MRIAIRKVGNSRGMIIPSAILSQIGLEDEAELTVEDGALVVRPANRHPRTGWAEASKEIAKAGDDELVMPDFGNEADARLQW